MSRGASGGVEAGLGLLEPHPVRAGMATRRPASPRAALGTRQRGTAMTPKPAPRVALTSAAPIARRLHCPPRSWRRLRSRRPRAARFSHVGRSDLAALAPLAALTSPAP